MKQICTLIVGLVLSSGCLAAPKPHLTHLVCAMKDHNGQSAMAMNISLNEAKKTVRWEKIDVPALYSNSEVKWVVGKSDNLQSGYVHRLNHYSGTLVVSIIGSKSQKYLVLYSGICTIAADPSRKF